MYVRRCVTLLHKFKIADVKKASISTCDFVLHKYDFVFSTWQRILFTPFYLTFANKFILQSKLFNSQKKTACKCLLAFGCSALSNRDTVRCGSRKTPCLLNINCQNAGWREWSLVVRLQAPFLIRQSRAETAVGNKRRWLVVLRRVNSRVKRQKPLAHEQDTILLQ